MPPKKKKETKAKAKKEAKKETKKKSRGAGKPVGWMEDFQDEAQREWLFRFGSLVQPACRDRC